MDGVRWEIVWVFGLVVGIRQGLCVLDLLLLI